MKGSTRDGYRELDIFAKLSLNADLTEFEYEIIELLTLELAASKFFHSWGDLNFLKKFSE